MDNQKSPASAVQIKGASGVNASVINGLYCPTGELIAGRPVYINEHNMFLTFSASDARWLGGQAAVSKGTANGKLCSEGAGALPSEVKSWKVLISPRGEEAQWDVQPVSVETTTIQAQAPVPVEVKGATGVNASVINGLYCPTGELIAGRPVYINEHNKFLTFSASYARWLGGQAAASKGTVNGKLYSEGAGALPSEVKTWNVSISPPGEEAQWEVQPVSVETATIQGHAVDVKGDNKRGEMHSDDLDDVQMAYKPLVTFVDSPPPGHTDDMKCSQYVKKFENHLADIKFLDEILASSAQVAASILSSPAAMKIGHAAMVFAIVLYTFDLCLIKLPSQFKRENNFYFCLNKKLRERCGIFLQAAHGYLYFLMTGLSRLPPAKGVVLRGIDGQKAQACRNKFITGATFHFSGFTSTAPNWSIAKSFAGSDGLVFRIKLLEDDSNGRDIHEVSAFGSSEAEVLLLPNFKIVVTGIGHDDGVQVVECVEMIAAPPLIDF